MSTKKHVSSGFTLLEILISIGVLATVSTLIAQVLFTTTHVNKKTELMRDIKQNGEFTLDVMERAIRDAHALETVCEVGAVSTPSAIIRAFDDEITTFTCGSDGASARVASISGMGTTVYLSGANVTLSQSGGKTCSDTTLTFSCPPVTGLPGPVTFSFTLSSLGASISAYERASQAFQSTVSLRN